MSIETSDPAQVFLPRLPALPYPGLRPFLKSEWPIFFGRERVTNDVIGQLLKARLLVVHGTSGNGKSSLVQAGVQANLEQQHARAGLQWHACSMRPGNSPATNLAKALADVDLAPDSNKPEAIEFRRALNQGRRSPEAIRQLLNLGDEDRVCIVLDQFEELFHLSERRDDNQSTLLTEFLVGFHENPISGIYILVTLRSEFLGECTRFAGLAETINRTQYLLPRMDTNDLLRAVREPATLYGGRVTERLAERLIGDARSGHDELPLIQHGLSRLWQFGLDGCAPGARPTLDLPDYVSRGPLNRILSEHADEVADKASGDLASRKIIAETFRALTEKTADGYAVRRPQAFADLCAVTETTAERLRSILDAFRQPEVSFVTPYPPRAIEEEK